MAHRLIADRTSPSPAHSHLIGAAVATAVCVAALSIPVAAASQNADADTDDLDAASIGARDAAILKESEGWWCGDGYRQPDEVCDGGDVQCSDFGYDSGSAGCDDHCFPDLSACVGVGYCQNYRIDEGEECDNDGHWRGTPPCDWGDPQCTECVDCEIVANPEGWCGDGVLQGDPFNRDEAGDHAVPDGAEGFEQCEPSIGLTIGCDYFGYASGNLGCTSDCRFDVGGCEGSVCGDGLIPPTGTEECDPPESATTCPAPDGYSAEKLCRYCDSECLTQVIVYERYCGDGEVTDGEICDTDVPVLCADLGFSGTGSRPARCEECINVDTRVCAGGSPVEPGEEAENERDGGLADAEQVEDRAGDSGCAIASPRRPGAVFLGLALVAVVITGRRVR